MEIYLDQLRYDISYATCTTATGAVIKRQLPNQLQIIYLRTNNAPQFSPPQSFLTDTLYAGLFYYLYNEVAYLALGVVDSPTTHAVGNTIKRVVVLVASTVYFKNPMSGQSMVGCAIAIGGVLLYSIESAKAKGRSKGKEKKK